MEAPARNFVMMPGSTTGKTYLLIGRNGKFALGIKPVAVIDGAELGLPGHTWFGAKLRSAPAHASLFESFEENKVVKIGPQATTPWDAWPMVEWEKKSQERASTTIGIMLEGTIRGGADAAEKLLTQVRDDLGLKMAEYLYQLIGEDYMLLYKGEIAEWFDIHLGKIADALEKAVHTAKAVTETMKQNVGFFTMQAEILKKVHEQLGNTAPATLPLIEPTAEYDGGADEGYEGDEGDEDESDYEG